MPRWWNSRVPNLWWAGDTDRVVDEIEQFLLGERNTQASHRQLVPIVLTDLVGSTAHASRVGDTDWRRLIDAHDDVTIAQTHRHGGTVIKQLGDGFLLRFPAAAVAIRAAVHICQALLRVGLHARIAVHAGEAEVRGDDVRGVAVHFAARVLEHAAPDEVLVTGVVRGLVAGSSIRFEERGRHQLKGIPDQWDLYAVTE